MRYVPALDGIRAVAILLVVAFHAKVPGMQGGFIGVDVFFVLSGYLITRLIAEQPKGSFSLPRFYWRRFMRLTPPMILMLAAYVAIAPHVIGPGNHATDALLSLLYLQDYARELGHPPIALNHLWSLSVEEHYYLVWPVLLLALGRFQRTTAAALLVGLYLGLTLWRAHVGEWAAYYRFDTHSTGLVLGSLAGYVRLKVPMWAGAVGVAGLLAMATHSEYGVDATIPYDFTVIELLSLLLVTSTLPLGSLAWLGKMSYGWYLWHYPIMKWMRGEDWHWTPTLLVGGGAGLALAVLSYYTIEAAVRAARERRTCTDALEAGDLSGPTDGPDSPRLSPGRRTA